MSDFVERFVERAEEHFRVLNDEISMSRTLNRQLIVVSLYGFMCNFVAWTAWIMPTYSDEKVGTFLWFTIIPMLTQMLCMLVCGMFRRIAYAIKRPRAFAPLGSLAYSCFFVSMVYFYRDIPIFWLFIIGPILLASFYRKFRWLSYTIIWTLAGTIGIIFLPENHSVYQITNPSNFMMAAEAVIIATLMAFLAFGLHVRIETTIKDKAKVEATKQAKDTFFTKMSHEIRTPINAVIGMNELILKEDTSPAVQKYSGNIKRAGQTLLALVNDILDSSRLESGFMEIVPAEYDLMELITDCYNLIATRAGEKGLEFRVSNDPNLPRKLIGDEMRVKQILTNLLSNAVKYTNDGFIELNISKRERGESDIELIFSVKDSGMGISEADLPHIFDTFERLDEKKNKYIEGTGLGLSITKSLTELMNGSITVDSKVDEGSTFTASIPHGFSGEEVLGDFNKNYEKSQPRLSTEVEHLLAPEATVLVVDDVKMNIDVFKGLLKRTQIKIDAAISAEKALKLASTQKYDVIFMDHIMPQMDGVEALHILREKEGPNVNTPVIALTANVTVNAEDEYREYGFDGFIAKPVKGKVLEETIRNYL